MQAMNCPRCGRLFKKVINPVCPRCEKLEEEQFQDLRHFLEDNPLATITECSDATGVPTKRILRYIREGRLVVPEGMVDEIRCVSCGKHIDEGNFCDDCTIKMTQELAGAYDDLKKKPDKKKEPKEGGKGKYHGASSPDSKGSGFHTR